MCRRVFISYSGKDEKQAKKIKDALEADKISCWLAPTQIEIGDKWRDEIVRGLENCAIVVLLWSKNASESQYVEAEIHIASGLKRSFIPVHLDETPYNGTAITEIGGLQTKTINRSCRKDDLMLIVKAVRKKFAALGILPFPLNLIYKNLNLNEQTTDLSMELHVEAVRMVTRLIALILVSRYLSLHDYDSEINQSVEELKEGKSFFTDLESASEIFNWLQKKGHDIPPGIVEVFQKCNFDTSWGAEYRVNRGNDVKDWDLQHLDRLLQTEASVANMRIFLRKLLSIKWIEACRFYISFQASDSKWAERQIESESDLPTLPDNIADTASIFLRNGSIETKLNPFFKLLKAADSNRCSMGMWRGQDEHAVYSDFARTGYFVSTEKPIVFPWGTLEVKRTIRSNKIYEGQTYEVALEFSNRGNESLEVLDVREVLPDNIVRKEGLSEWSLPASFVLEAGRSQTTTYTFQGKGAGLTRCFLNEQASVTYAYQGIEESTVIYGDKELTVHRMPLPHLKVSRALFDSDGKEIRGNAVFLDSRITVKVTIESLGAKIPNVSIKEHVIGAKFLSGKPLLYEGALDSVDRQKPIVRKYELLVCGESTLELTTIEAKKEEQPKITAQKCLKTITALPQPLLELRWQNVRRLEAPSPITKISAALIVNNRGGTSLYAFRIQPKTSPDISVKLENNRDLPDKLVSNEEITIPLHIEIKGEDHKMVSTVVEGQSVQQTPVFSQIELNLERLIDWDAISQDSFGSQKSLLAISQALRESGDRIINISGERGLKKRRLAANAVLKLKRESQYSVDMIEYDCQGSVQFASAISKLLERVIRDGWGGATMNIDEAIELFLDALGISNDGREKENLSKLIINREQDTGTWRTAAVVLERLAKIKKLDRLIILLQGISRFDRSELTSLNLLKEEIEPDSPIRIVTTSAKPLTSLGVIAEEFEVTRMSPEVCTKLISHIFIFPPAHRELERKLIERSELIPSQFEALIHQLQKQANELLNFKHPHGVHLEDEAAFNALPNNSVAFERKIAESVDPKEVPQMVLACFACIDGTISEKVLEPLLGKLGENSDSIQRQEWLEICSRKYHWLKVTNEAHHEYIIASYGVRLALQEATTQARCERVYEALYELHLEGGRSQADWWRLLMNTSIEFIRKHGQDIIRGIKTSLATDSYSEIQEFLVKVDQIEWNLADEVELEILILACELRRKVSGELNEAMLERLWNALRNSPKTTKQENLLTRLSLISSQHYLDLEHTEANLAKANQALEPAYKGKKFWRKVRATDPELLFNFHLYLWELCYLSVDEERFVQVDKWIWSRLLKNLKSHHGPRHVSTYLRVFERMQARFPEGSSVRKAKFPERVEKFLGRMLPVGDSEIELRTRMEKLEPLVPWFFEYTDEKKESARIMGSIYLCRGENWDHETKQTPQDSEKKKAPKENQTIEKITSSLRKRPWLSDFTKAEEFFEKGGFLKDMAMLHHRLGNIYFDGIQLLDQWIDAEDELEPIKSEEDKEPWEYGQDESPLPDDRYVYRETNETEKNKKDEERKKHQKEATVLLTEFCGEGIRWLDLAVREYERIYSPSKAINCLEMGARLFRYWLAYDRKRSDRATEFYEYLLQHPFVTREPAMWDDYRLILVNLYEAQGRYEEAANLINNIAAPNDETNLHSACVNAERLLLVSNTIKWEEIEDYEQDYEYLSQARHETLDTSKRLHEISNIQLNRALGILAWNLAKAHHKEDGGHRRALQLIRDNTTDIVETNELREDFEANITNMLPSLWNQNGGSCTDITSDFASIVMKLHQWGESTVIAKLCDEVWRYGMLSNNHACKSAAPDLYITFVETQQIKDPTRETTLSAIEHVLGWLEMFNPDELRSITSVVARSLAASTLYHSKFKNAKPLQKHIEKLQARLEHKDTIDVLMQILIHLAELLMEHHRRTSDDWFKDMVLTLASRLDEIRTKQEENRFEDTSRLILLYLQLPNHRTDAIELMEAQCKRLLHDEDYPQLSKYLSFLSDLLQSSEVLDQKFLMLMQWMKKKQEGEDTEIEPLIQETLRENSVEKMAQQLCCDIIRKVRDEAELHQAINVLYDAVKLLKGKRGSRLTAAIYLKLYSNSIRTDGSYVWGIFSNWREFLDMREKKNLLNAVAFTSLANIGDNDIRLVMGNPRNYLINSRARSMFLKELLDMEPQNMDFASAYVAYEFKRLIVLTASIKRLETLLEMHNDFEQMMILKFFVGYLFPEGGQMSQWQMVQKIKSYNRHQNEWIELIHYAVELGVIDQNRLMDIARTKKDDPDGHLRKPPLEAHFEERTHDFMNKLHTQARHMMNDWASSLASASLQDVLTEVLRYLENKTELVDYCALLDGWPSDDHANLREEKANQERMEAQLDRLGWEKQLDIILEQAQRASGESEFRIAEGLYRRALEILDNEPSASPEWRAKVYRGLMHCLMDKKDFEEALEYAERVLAIYTRNQGPVSEWTAAHEDVATLLNSLERIDEASSHWRQAIEISQKDKGENTLKTLEIQLTEKYGQFLRESRQEEEAQTINTRLSALMNEHWNLRSKQLFTSKGRTNDVALAHNQFGVECRNNGYPELAEKHHSTALEIDQSLLGDRNYLVPHRMNNLAITYVMQEKLEEAEKLLSEAFNIQETLGHDVTSGRILLVMMMIAYLQDRTTDTIIEQLKSIFELPEWKTEGKITEFWDFTSVIDFLYDKNKLTEEQRLFLNAVLDSLNDRKQLATLDGHPDWK